MTNKKSRTHLYEQIDANLRKAYQETLNEELPERFQSLIDRLRSGEVPDASDVGARGPSE